MIKTVAYFPEQCALNSGPVMSRLLDCLQARGFKTEENSMNSDAAVIWSVLWHGRMARNELVYRHYRNQNKPVIIVDRKSTRLNSSHIPLSRMPSSA